MFSGGGGSGGGGGGMGGGGGDIAAHFNQFFGGLTGMSDAPYKDAMKQYEKWARKGEGVQNPFLQFGERGIPLYEQWLSGQQDPTKFMNGLMDDYQESPWAKFQQDQAVRSAQSMGSKGDTAAGGIGSTPLTQFIQQNAKNISSEDMNKWLQNVLGINTQYGEGLGKQVGVGQNSANSLTQMYNDMSERMGAAAYGREAGKNQDRANTWGGLFNLGGDAAKAYFMGGM